MSKEIWLVESTDGDGCGTGCIILMIILGIILTAIYYIFISPFVFVYQVIENFLGPVMAMVGTTALVALACYLAAMSYKEWRESKSNK